MPGVDRECTTHHACGCIQAKCERLERLANALGAEVQRYAEPQVDYLETPEGRATISERRRWVRFIQNALAD